MPSGFISVDLQASQASEEIAETFQKVFAISHEDIKHALYNLLLPYEEADNDYYYISAVYDNYFAYEGWMTGAIYGQNYTKDGDNVAFDGERFNLHRELLTDSEYAELMSMRANYAALAQFKTDTENAQLRAQRETILSDQKYSVLAEKGYFDKAELLKLRKTGAMLQGHPDMKHIPGVDMTTGSLGQGLSVANGMAMASKLGKEGEKTSTIAKNNNAAIIVIEVSSITFHPSIRSFK